MSAPKSVNGASVRPLTRLPPTEPPDADALRALHNAGAHLLLAAHNKVPFNKAWEQQPADIDAVIAHRRRGGLVGIMPGSIGAVVIDLDPDDDTAPVAAPPATGNGTIVDGTDGRRVHLNAAAVASLARETEPPLGVPVLQHVTRRAGGVHYWYRAPAGEVGNRQWARTAGGKHVGEVRGTNGFVILWDAGAVAAAVVSDDFAMADAVDVDSLPRPRKPTDSKTGRRLTGAEAIRAATPGARNDTLFTEACFAIERGENLAPLRAAAIASGLSEREVDATIASAEGRTEKKPPSVTAGRPTKDGIDAGEAALALAPSMRGCVMFATGRGWFTRGSVTALWRPADDATMLDRLQRSDTWWTCKRGTRTSAILGELTGPLRVDGALLDADDWTCGLPDGRVLDLRTGEVRAAVEADRITMALRAVPEPGEPLVWLRVLGDTFSYMDEPEAVLAYFRWWIRHALTGDCSAQRMAFLHGQSGTGKNTVADALLHLFDDYGQAIPAVHVVGRRDSHRAWIAQCDRKRYVLVGDLPEHGSWSTELHDMVGGADLNANFMRQNHFTFRSRAHVLATGNDAPRGQAGIWRRLAQYECRHKPTPPDTALKEKLEAEAGRILQWALDAPIAEPTMPAELRLAAEAVRDEQNPVRAWIRETWKGDPLGLTGSAAMFARYKARFHDVPEREQLTETAFGRMVTGEFGPSRRKTVDGAQASIRQCVEV